MIFIKSLLQFHGDDFEVWQSEKQLRTNNYWTYYNIGIEGYLGFTRLQSGIDLYKEFQQILYNFLIVNNYAKTEKHMWDCIYQTREISVCYENECYWIFLDGHESTQIWDLYYYLDDVIKQLEGIDLKEIAQLGSGNDK
jgi:hypothetical protein